MQNTHLTVSAPFSKWMMIIVRVKLEAEVGFSVKGLFKAAFQYLFFTCTCKHVKV